MVDMRNVDEWRTDDMSMWKSDANGTTIYHCGQGFGPCLMRAASWHTTLPLSRIASTNSDPFGVSGLQSLPCAVVMTHRRRST